MGDSVDRKRRRYGEARAGDDVYAVLQQHYDDQQVTRERLMADARKKKLLVEAVNCTSVTMLQIYQIIGVLRADKMQVRFVLFLVNNRIVVLCALLLNT